MEAPRGKVEDNMRAYLLCAVTVLLGSASSACGGGSDLDDSEPEDGSGGQTSSGGSTADGGSPATGGDSATGGNAGEAFVPAELFPLAVGNTWTHEVTEKSPGACVSEPAETVVSTVTIDGVPAFNLSSACFGLAEGDYSTLAVNGPEIVQQLGGTWATTLAAPLADGHSWTISSGAYTFTWHEVGQVTVPAGTFDGCWRRAITPGETAETTTFCRGVGPVIRENSSWRLELSDYELN
jgi:hypothetical protein